jgi:hypothetical protein
VRKTEAIPTAVTVADVLDAVPVRNQSVREERKSDEEIVIFVPMGRRWYMGPPLSWVLPFSKERGVGLDRLGREVWEACDGKRTAERIVEEFAARHHVTFHEARLSVLSFLRELTRRGLVVMVKGTSEGAGR